MNERKLRLENEKLRNELRDARAALDALTQRAERAERLLDEAEAERDQALEEAEEQRRKWKGEYARGKAAHERAKQLDEALALADARGRALEEIAHSAEHIPNAEQAAKTVIRVAKRALEIPAPEALRQQQEREEGKDALIERLRGALETLLPYTRKLNIGGLIPATSWPLDVCTEALAITPPQALREREERVWALEKAYVRFKAIVDGLDCACDDGFTCTLHADRRLIEAIDAKKGGR